jgi:hypothetical protein
LLSEPSLRLLQGTGLERHIRTKALGKPVLLLLYYRKRT